ncbi:hypothetical protein B0H63DRAFT_565004 [Podospora didyma]|uniref:Protein kinase domain-containing protein n=1 Tax=Podospora didyma TaxID=330526 RepID=A0AAE0K1F1_9PEZI|nr:hypothetical protein B0H63DRAFT_565004 [Podospora didyma]
MPSSSGSDSEDEADRLASRVTKLYHKSPFNEPSCFFPAGAYKGIVDADIVKAELGLGSGQLSSVDEALVDFVLGPALRVFLIVICVIPHQSKARKIMRCFLQNNFRDQDLPVDDDTFSQHAAFSSRSWTSSHTCHSFCHHQWMHLAPVFSGDKFFFRLEREQPLPFTERSLRHKEGASSTVYEVVVHEDHLETPPFDFKGERRKIAIKEIRPIVNDTVDDFSTQFDNEARALAHIRDLKHPHIIQWLAAFTRGPEHYLMFPWADGGNLREFWKDTDTLSVNTDSMRCLVRECLTQFRGLADALVKLHVHKKYRHGDVKPENILRLLDGTTSTGILQIADFGLAKQHSGPTFKRGPTSTRHTTLQYESPEAEVATKGETALSRLSDIWSLGCVMLEHLMWLLYGDTEVVRFDEELKGNSNDNTSPFYQRTAGGNAVLRMAVSIWMKHMKEDPECAPDTVMGELLRIIEGYLLVIPIPKNWNDEMEAMQSIANPKLGTRASARELLYLLDKILEQTESKDGTYLFKGTGIMMKNGKPKRDSKGPTSKPFSVPVRAQRPETPPVVDMLDPFAAHLRGPAQPAPIRNTPIPHARLDRSALEPKAGKMNKTWNFSIDSELAPKLLNRLGREVMFPKSLGQPAQLCRECAQLDFGEPGFSFSYSCDDMERRASKCSFCEMLLGICTEHDKSAHKQVKFARYRSTLMKDDDTTPVLSIIPSPELKTVTPLQIGFPKLPESGSDTHFEIIRQWLQHCDKSHECIPANAPVPIPTRLIDVGSAHSHTVRLVETKELGSLTMGKTSPYIALSHRWGDVPSEHFCTFPDSDPADPKEKNTLSQHKVAIEVSTLPATFRDAVLATRALGKQYLWIDSICIIQGPKGDFKDEAKKMEDVFSSAYCVLAANWGTSQKDGFLKTMPGQEDLKAKRDRKVVTIQPTGKQPLYVCEMIDDFDEHVLKGDLSKRAWVLQERALARRTVYFTERQTYWECGKGVRCETMTQMTNKLASFLGDPSFPSLALNGNRGEEIRWYQELYAQYSRLGISHVKDRPIAIRGLESRLIAELKRKYQGFEGAHGVLDDGPSGGLLHRSLMWRRGHDVMSLKRIVFPSGHDGAPSWSWMSYEDGTKGGTKGGVMGGIDFIQMEGSMVEWEASELISPWKTLRPGGDARNVRTILARARDFGTDVKRLAADRDFGPDTKQRREETNQLIFDSPGGTSHNFKCVVVGREKMKEADPVDAKFRTHFVLIVAPASIYNRGSTTGASRNLKVYKRIGAGAVAGWCISLDGEGEEIAII